MRAGHNLSVVSLMTACLAMICGFAGCQGYSRYRHMTDTELMFELAQPENRMPNTWRDVTGCFEISENGCGGGVGADLDFGGSVPGAVSYAIRDEHSPFFKRPSSFAALLTANNPELVLTTLWIYGRVVSFPNQYSLMKADFGQVVTVIRSAPLRHRDTRVRWMALHVLEQLHGITAEDLAAGLTDLSIALRLKTLQCLYHYSPRQERDARTLLVPLLIDCLEDAHPAIRQQAWEHLVRMVRPGNVRESSSSRPADTDSESPARFPRAHWRLLVQADWHTRHKFVEEVRAVWRDHSDAIITRSMSGNANDDQHGR